MTDQCEMCAGTKVDTVFGGRCEWCDETGQRRGLTPLPNGPLAMLPAMLDAVNHGVGVMLITAHKGAEHVPLQAFLKEPLLTDRFVELNMSNYGQDEVDALQAWAFEAHDELAALREELATLHDQHAEQSCVFCNNSGELLTEVKSLQQRLAAAEQRNSELIDLLRDIEATMDAQEDSVSLGYDAECRMAAVLRPTESGASGLTCNQIREESDLPINKPCVACNNGACIDR